MCTGHYSQGAGNESSPPRPQNLIITTMCVLGIPKVLSVAIATPSMIWRGSGCEERICQGRPPRGVRDPLWTVNSHYRISPTYESERQTDHTCAWPVFSPLVLYSHCYDMTHRILCVSPCFHPITLSSVVMRLAPEICGKVFKRLE